MLWLSQKKYGTKVLERSNMCKAKPVGSTLSVNCKINARQCLRGEMDKAKMKKVSYASTIGSLMYVMVFTRSNIAFAVRMVSLYMSNP